jgi:hypothetical protein
MAGQPGGFMGQPGGFKGQPGGFGGQPGGFSGQPGGGDMGSTPPPSPPKTSTPDGLAFALKEMLMNNPTQRVKGLEYIAEVCQDSDLAPSQAEPVAAYLLAVSGQEAQAVAPLLPKLGRFKALHLAVADKLDDANVNINQLAALVSYLTGKQANLDKNKDWRKQSKVLLLQHALTMSDTLPEGDAVQMLLRDLYDKQAAVMGLIVPTKVKTTSGILELMVVHVGGQIDQHANASDATKKFIKGIPKQLVAIKYLANGNDIQHTVLLQRLWLDLLGEKLALEQPAKAKQAKELCHQLDGLCHEQGNALSQMWLCDQYLLRMWLLYLNEPAKQGS